ncbi:elongation factor P hydroxylase [Paraneptunicella aestuarii]|uniref:elongation factor P hydroxylase n=1 Tax=Paraneptunicella aestuarii TaxID=2831148 RepID=UPI001E5ADF6A|nr:elongation factor P hydroxylase [Paraneptunicella aestuarii]UAA37509.1 elongation factor P hydroxylase [Paraneptunicella aestuarii]
MPNSHQQPEHHYSTLIALFDEVFFHQYNTRLVKGDNEPIYLPADEQHSYHRIVFAHGFFASALHEIAHWCVAGAERRKLVDFGYWYCPDGRSAEQQAEFEKVEIKPQALEWCFSVAAGFPFKVSVDNLSGEAGDRFAFQETVYQQVKAYMQQGLPKRAQMFVDGLRHLFNTPELTIDDFAWEKREVCDV